MKKIGKSRRKHRKINAGVVELKKIVKARDSAFSGKVTDERSL